MSKESIRQAVETAQSISPTQRTENVFDFSPTKRSSDDWPEIKPLIRPLPPAPPFPVDALGALLSKTAMKIHDAVKAPVAICGQSILAAATLAVQPIADIELDGRVIPISNFFMTLGESGERKTAVDQWALRAHKTHELQQKEVYDKAEKDYHQAKRIYEEKRKSITRKRSATQAQIEKELKALGPEPEPPLQPYILVNDPTIEGLMKLLQFGQPSVGLFSDEGGRFIGSYSMNSEHTVQSISTLSNLWDGSPVDRIRGGDGFSKLYGRRLSSHLMVQPRIAGILIGNQTAQEQGILARFLISFPSSTAGSRSYESKDLSSDPDLIKYYSRIRRCLESPLKLAENSRNELRPKKIQLSADAKELWITFHNAIENELSPRGKYAVIKAFASKAAEHALRLAAVLTLIEEPDAAEIPAERIDSATLLVDYYLEESLRLCGIGSSSPLDIQYQEAERLWDWLQLRSGSKGPVISVVEIYQSGPRFVRTAQKARSLMRTLALHGFVRRQIIAADGERSKSEIYEIRINSS